MDGLKIFFFVLVSILFACNPKTSTDTEETCPEFDLLKITEYISDISPYIDQTDVIPLTTDDSLIVANITKILLTGNGNMVALSSSRIFSFDGSGKIISRFGRIGRRLGEYMKIYLINLK